VGGTSRTTLWPTTAEAESMDDAVRRRGVGLHTAGIADRHDSGAVAVVRLAARWTVTLARASCDRVAPSSPRTQS
jgi:hypothetical protein